MMSPLSDMTQDIQGLGLDVTAEEGTDGNSMVSPEQTLPSSLHKTATTTTSSSTLSGTDSSVSYLGDNTCNTGNNDVQPTSPTVALSSTPRPLVRVLSHPPSSLSVFPRRLKEAVVTPEYDPQRSWPELEFLLQGRPKLTLPPTETSSTSNNDNNHNTTTIHERKTELELSVETTLDQTREPQPALAPHQSNDNNLQLQSPFGPSLLESEQSKSCALETPLLPTPEKQSVDWTLDPPPMRPEAWTETDAHDFSVRGPTYNSNGVKVPSQASALELFAVDLVQVEQPLWGTGLSQHPDERIQRALRHEQETGVRELPEFCFLVNILLPSSNGCFYHWVAYFGTNEPSLLCDTTTPFGRLAKPFFFGGKEMDDYRNRIFKLIPRVAEGNFVVRSAVGGKPTLLGRKLKQHFLVDDSTEQLPRRFMEVVIDISSNPVANRIVKLALGYAKTLSIDLMFLLEGGGEVEVDGQTNGEDAVQSTLPERILCGVRMKQIDFAQKDGKRKCFSPAQPNECEE